MSDENPTKATILKRVEEAKEQLEKIPSSKVRGQFSGFITFVREQGVVGLAIGLVLGVAAKSVVDSLVNNIFNPIVGALSGSPDLSSKFVCLRHNEIGQCGSKLGYGNVINALLSFLIVAGVVYVVVKSLKLDKIDKPKAK
jgi:large conductance mechanosensitive channel